MTDVDHNDVGPFFSCVKTLAFKTLCFSFSLFLKQNLQKSRRTWIAGNPPKKVAPGNLFWDPKSMKIDETRAYKVREITKNVEKTCF